MRGRDRSFDGSTGSLAAIAEGLQRIVVVGRAGAGKTTVALRLGEALGIPVVHLDALFWTSGWKEVDEAVFDARQQAAIDQPAWVIDGGYTRSAGWRARLDRADLVIVAEAPLVVCLWRVVRRAFPGRPSRADLPAGGEERVSRAFLWWLITWSRRHPNLPEQMRRESGKPVLVVRRLSDLEPILNAVDPRRRPPGT